MTDDNRNYLLDFRQSGTIGPMRIITLNFAVAEGKDYDQTVDWLTKKLFDNKRGFTLGEYGPHKAGLLIKEDPPENKEMKDYERGWRD